MNGGPPLIFPLPKLPSVNPSSFQLPSLLSPFSLRPSVPDWLNLLHQEVTFSTTPLKCCHFTLAKCLRRFPFINAVVDESLRVRSSQSTERVSAGQLFQIIGVAGKLSSTIALINENNASRLLSRTMELIINIFSNNLTNFSVWLIFNKVE